MRCFEDRMAKLENMTHESSSLMITTNVRCKPCLYILVWCSVNASDRDNTHGWCKNETRILFLTELLNIHAFSNTFRYLQSTLQQRETWCCLRLSRVFVIKTKGKHHTFSISACCPKPCIDYKNPKCTHFQVVWPRYVLETFAQTKCAKTSTRSTTRSGTKSSSEDNSQQVWIFFMRR